MKPFFYLALAGMFLASCSKPLADFSTQNSSKNAPANTTFTNQSKKAETYHWDFGDGQTSDEANPVHPYTKEGEYTVVLEAKKGKKISKTTKTITLEAPKACLVEIETEFGTMIVQLYDATPEHRDNFLKLAAEGFYDDLLFHRVINGFMVQGGDPKSRGAKPGQNLGSGGPDYTVKAEFVDTLFHVKGALAAARTGDNVNPEKRSSGSQFYIVHGRPATDQQLDQLESQQGFRYPTETRNIYKTQGGTPMLDKNYTVFGRVISGLEVIDKIAATPTAPGDRPKTDVKMKIRVL
jgi:cyclophilin family peptidyl-prolyl cis-trans isomerase